VEKTWQGVAGSAFKNSIRSLTFYLQGRVSGSVNLEYGVYPEKLIFLLEKGMILIRLKPKRMDAGVHSLRGMPDYRIS